jgi:hypothetical protein
VGTRGCLLGFGGEGERTGYKPFDLVGVLKGLQLH